MFLIDQYRPTSINDSHFHFEILKLLEVMSKNDNIPHIIFYGPEGSGKRTIINIFLEMLFDSGVHKTKDTTYKVVGSGNKKNDVVVKQSDYHIVIEPQNNNFDRYLIHDIVKEYAKRRSLGIFKTDRPYRVILINNIDNMSYYAQTSLRRTMEIYSDKCRFVMWCKSLSKVIAPLRNSRCIAIRIPAPTDNEMLKYIIYVSVKENMLLSIDQYINIVKNANGDVKHALWDLQFMKSGYELNTNYTQTITKIIDLLLENKLENVPFIRNALFSIMITNFDGTTILRDIIDAICMHTKLSETLKFKIINSSGYLEHQLIKGRREIMQFDAFIISAIKFINDEKMSIQSKN